MRFFLVEDQEFNRFIIEHSVSKSPGWKMAGEASSVSTANAWLDQHQADVLMVDIGLPPPGDGFLVVQHALRVHPAIRILVLTAHLNEYIIACCEKFRVHGFFNKREAAIGRLASTLKTIAGGASFFPPEYEKAHRSWLADSRAIAKLLSEREDQVLHLIALGKSDAEIATELGIQESTATTHKSAILRKLNQPNTAKLTVFAINRGYGRLSY